MKPNYGHVLTTLQYDNMQRQTTESNKQSTLCIWAYLANPMKSSWFVFMYASWIFTSSINWSFVFCSFSRIFVLTILSVSSLKWGYRAICINQSIKPLLMRLLSTRSDGQTHYEWLVINVNYIEKYPVNWNWYLF